MAYAAGQHAAACLLMQQPAQACILLTQADASQGSKPCLPVKKGKVGKKGASKVVGVKRGRGRPGKAKASKLAVA